MNKTSLAWPVGIMLALIGGFFFVINSGDAELAATSPAHGHYHSDAAHAAGEHTAKFVQVSDIRMVDLFTCRPDRGDICRFSYQLKEPARVNIRVKRKGTRELFLATIVGSEYRAAGRHEEEWSGLDYSNKPIDMSQVFVTVVAEKASFELGSFAMEALSDEAIVHSEHDHIHGTHHADAEETPILTLLEPASDAVVDGLITVRSAVDPERRGYGNTYGYGVRYYIDGELFHEEFYAPQSNGQFAYEFDTAAFADGSHTLHVGLCDHNQHVTSASVPLRFSNSR